MTLVLSTSKSQLLLVLLFAHKLRAGCCLQANLTLQSDFFQSPSPGIQRWGCKCAQDFSVKRVKGPYVKITKVQFISKREKREIIQAQNYVTHLLKLSALRCKVAHVSSKLAHSEQYSRTYPFINLRDIYTVYTFICIYLYI